MKAIGRALALLALAPMLLVAAEEEVRDLAPAMRAAQAWIELLDRERYGEAWEGSGEVFKQTIPRLRWEASIQAARDSLGGVLGRKVRSATYTAAVPGAPPGEYVVVEFNTAFAKRPLAVETVTPRREADGSWKVSGYLIR